MRNLVYLDKYRVDGEQGQAGAFRVPLPLTDVDKLNGVLGRQLVVIASNGLGWDHVSVRAVIYKVGQEVSRTPTWDEMCAVKRLFFHDHECAVQYHPPESDYVNIHPNVLHIWRPQNVELPQPDRVMV
jgi:hypothetical protein